MKQSLVLLSLIAAMSAAPALAQTTPEQGTEQPATSNIGGGLDMGEGAGAEQAGPRQYVREVFGDWKLQCLEVADADDVCQMYQLLKDEQGSAIAEASVFQIANGGQAVAGGTFVVPLETLLSAKLNISVDGGPPRRYDYAFCNPVGCYARVGFTADDIARFKAGAEATLSLIPALAPDQQVNVSMSLKGFTAAYDQTSALNQ